MDPSPDLVDDCLLDLIEARDHMLSRVDKACDEKQKINGAVIEWLEEADKLIEELNQSKSKEEETYEWCSKMVKELRTLHQKSNFQKFYIPSGVSQNKLPKGVESVYTPLEKSNPDTGKRGMGSLLTPGNGNTTRIIFTQAPGPDSSPSPTCAEPKPTQARAFSGWVRSKSSPTSSVKPMPPISNPRAESTSSKKSKKKASQQQLEALEDDTCGKTRSHSSANTREEAWKKDTFQDLQTSSGNFMYLGSTNQAKNDLLEALQDDTCHSIGLFGERGSGKTALVNSEISRYQKIFHPVVFVTVSEKADIANLQNQIAPLLNLNFQGVRSQYKRASAIESTLLKNKGKVLVIFDDVSTNFEPQDIGIPIPSKHCKIILITHDKKYCNMMRCNPLIPLRPLSNEDAWKLLQQYSGIDRDSPPDLFNVAQKVSILCKGLPRIIENVLSSLHNKSTDHWTETLDCLSHLTANHQIFISFRGKDTRDDFTASLFDALVQGGFKVFKDDEQLRSGDQVSEALIKAIEQSRCSIVVLSENYAESSWCLDELVKILNCREEMKQLVLPIFYKVDPSHVRYLKESFGEAITKKKERFEEDKIQEWTSALFKVAGLSGRDYKKGSQIAFIKEIVQYVRDNKHRLHIV